MNPAGSAASGAGAARAVLLPLALAQFLCSYAGSSMNVMINDISTDLDTTVQGVQVAITLFLLVMAALMIPGGKLTDRYGRTRCLTAGLALFGVGALVSALLPNLLVLIIGNSILEGVGTALLIPPVYILTTLLFTQLPSRARAFGAISALGGIGAAAGPLLGGTRPFDTRGAVLSAGGLVLLVTGILAIDCNGWAALALIGTGGLVLGWFYASLRGAERAGREPLLATVLFRNRTSNLGMVTQNTQWLLLTGVSFVVAAYLQVVRGYDAIATGVIFTAETAGLLVASLAAGRLARRFAQRTLILTGYPLTLTGIVLLVTMAGGTASVWAFSPGLLLIGLGLGLMLTPSVTVVQSSFDDTRRGEISGLSRSVSNLGSCLGTAIASTILVAEITTTPERGYGLALLVLAAIGILGLIAAALLPTSPAPRTPSHTRRRQTTPR